MATVSTPTNTTPGFNQLASGLTRAIHDVEEASPNHEAVTFRRQSLAWTHSAFDFVQRYRTPLIAVGLISAFLLVRRARRT